MASLTLRDAILKEIRDCVLTENEERCRQISPYIHSFRKDLHVKNGSVCIDDISPCRTQSKTPMCRRSMQHTQGVGDDGYGGTCVVAVHAS